jgi:hypothetical protein
MKNYWKPEEIDALRRMRQEGKTVSEVAIHLGRNYRSVVDKTRYLREREGFSVTRTYRTPCAHHKTKVDGDMAGRKCLCCGKQFPSAHKFNRICFQCSESEIFGSGPTK